MTTLKTLLDLPRFSSLQVITPLNAIDRPIETVDITETPDVANFVSNRAIILTTAMAFKDDQSKLKSFIDSLKEKEVGAIGIKTGRFITKIDQEVVDYAASVDVPIFKIPMNVPLGTLLYEMLSFLWDSQTEKLTLALDIQKKFSRSLMEDINVEQFVDEISTTINAPVALMNPWHDVISESNYFARDELSISSYIGQLTTSQYNKINQHSQTYVVRTSANKPVRLTGYPINVNHYFPFYLFILETT